jgi:hypothetical protein
MIIDKSSPGVQMTAYIEAQVEKRMLDSLGRKVLADGLNGIIAIFHRK